MKKKKTTTSKAIPKKYDREKYRKLKEITLADGSVEKQEYGNQRISKPVYIEKIEDPELKSAPKDEASKHKYPPPKNDPVFRKKWMSFIDSIESRENFKQSHLDALEVLCDLYAEYEELNRIIRTEGRTYRLVSRFGHTIKVRPEVTRIDKVQLSIRNYTKLLDLFPKKDHRTESGTKADADEWG